MTAPLLPVRLRASLGVAGTWTDITSRVRYSDGVTVNRGRGSGDRLTPSTCEFVAENTDGVLSPRNPMSPWYGLLGRNAPVRVARVDVLDEFARTLASGFGTTPDGQVWSTLGVGGVITATDWSVGSGVATVSCPTAGTLRIGYLGAYTARDVDARVTLASMSVVDVLGGPLEFGLIVRGVGAGSSYYQVVASIAADQTVTVSIVRHDGTVLLVPQTTGITYTGQPLRLRVASVGASLLWKLWAVTSGVDGGEPLAWMGSRLDGVPMTSGWVGVIGWRRSSNSNVGAVQFRFDNFTVERTRFTGFLSEIVPQWDQSGRDVTVVVRADGPTRQIGQGDREQDAPRRYLPKSGTTGINAPHYYWPLQEGALVTGGAPVVGAGTAVLSSPEAASKLWGRGDLGPWLLPGLALVTGSSLTVSLSMPPQDDLGRMWAVDHVRAGDVSADTILLIRCRPTNLGETEQEWQLNFRRTADTADGVIDLYTPGTDTAGIPAPGLWDGNPHHVRVFVENPVTPTDRTYVYVNVDSVVVGSFTIVGVRSLLPTQVELLDPNPHTEPFAVGHLTVYGAKRPTSEFADPVLGRPLERALTRVQRLATTDGRTRVYPIGVVDDSARMGVEQPSTLLEAMQACADADAGLLYEARGVDRFTMRTVRSLYNQTAVATLDYANGEFDAPPLPADDDTGTANLIIGKRTLGGTVEVEQTTGPLSTAAPGTATPGVGEYPRTVEWLLSSDIDLLGRAQWARRLGTVDEPRYPRLPVLLTHPRIVDDPVLLSGLLDADVGDVVAVLNPKPGIGRPETVRQLVRGYKETLDQFTHHIDFTGEPASPYDVAIFDTTRYADSGTSTLAAGVSTSATSLSVATPALPLWTTTGAHFPLDVMVGGERMTVTAITGAASPQTFTVTRSVNGVAKAHLTGALVTVADQPAVGL